MTGIERRVLKHLLRHAATPWRAAEVQPYITMIKCELKARGLSLVPFR